MMSQTFSKAITSRRPIHLTTDNSCGNRHRPKCQAGAARNWLEAREAHEFIRRFLTHVLLKGQHRIRHYGFLGNGGRTANIARIRELLAAPAPVSDTEAADTADGPRVLVLPCPCCGGRLVIVAAFGPGSGPRHRPAPEGIDSS